MHSPKQMIVFFSSVNNLVYIRDLKSKACILIHRHLFAIVIMIRNLGYLSRAFSFILLTTLKLYFSGKLSLTLAFIFNQLLLY